MVEEDGYVHDGWLKRMCCSWQTAVEDRFVHGRKLEKMVFFMADGCRGSFCSW
jgi:hypothetical protein